MNNNIFVLDKEYKFNDDNSLKYSFLMNNTSNIRKNKIESVIIKKDKVYEIIYNRERNNEIYIGRIFNISPDSVYIDISDKNNGKRIRLLLDNITYCKEVEDNA